MKKKKFILVLGVTTIVAAVAGWFSASRFGFQMPSQTQTKGLLLDTKASLRAYHAQFNGWPSTMAALTNTFQSSEGVSNNLPSLIDEWGRPLIYQPFDSAKGYGAVISYGRDGKPGGKGEDADLEVRFGP